LEGYGRRSSKGGGVGIGSLVRIRQGYSPSG
jgi:hypothetical protein